ncbi:MAG: STY0301 family protein [Geminicoccales bacterium]
MISSALIVSLPAMALADVSCPMKIDVEQRLTAPQPGWTEGLSGLPTELAGVSVFDGPPEELAGLIPDAGADAADVTSDIWNLSKNDRGYWLTCRYSSTTVTLTRQLPATVTRCETVYEKDLHFVGGDPVVRSVVCSPGD